MVRVTVVVPSPRDTVRRRMTGGHRVPRWPPDSARADGRPGHVRTPPHSWADATSATYARGIATHYQLLGLRADASPQEIRDAYRARARRHHPDRVDSAAGDGRSGSSAMSDMSAINEAYRVLSDPGRRMLYDRSLREGAAGGPGDPGGGDHGDIDDHDDRVVAPNADRHHSRLSPPGPARMPWKMMAVTAVLGSAIVLVGAAFTDPPSEEPPDGILRVGSCVALEPNGDAREVACTGSDDDLIVELLLPTDQTCPFPLAGHRDRLGLGLACLAAD